jgi:hypothetical protein
MIRLSTYLRQYKYVAIFVSRTLDRLLRKD